MARSHLGQLTVAITVEVLAFVVPLLWFHREMIQAKVNLLQEADQLSMHMLSPHAQVEPGRAGESATKLSAEQARERYEAIEQMPTWPVDVRDPAALQPQQRCAGSAAVRPGGRPDQSGPAGLGDSEGTGVAKPLRIALPTRHLSG